MRIVFTVEVASQHAARWINQLKETDWDIHIFQGTSNVQNINPNFSFGNIYLPYPLPAPKGVKIHSLIPSIHESLGKLFIKFRQLQILKKTYDNYLEYQLRQIKPDIVHTLGLCVNFQNMCESIVKIKKNIEKQLSFPMIYSSWGADLDYYAKLSNKNYDVVYSALQEYEYHIAECQRDRKLAKDMGFMGKFLGYFPGAGGISAKLIQQYTSSRKCSKRKIILVKGRDQSGNGDPIGRAMTAMRAFTLCKKELQGYEINIMQASAGIIPKVEKLARTNGVKIKVLPYLPYDKLLKIYAKSRVFIALTINDGLPNSLVEAISLGAFPIHSSLSSTREWITNGKNGFLVPAENELAVANALKKALTNDNLVDKANEINKRITREKLTMEVIRPKVIKMYKNIYKTKN